MIYHFLNGEFVSEQKSSIGIFDLGLLRGYGVFDYVQLYKGMPFHLMDHLKRLEWSARQIEITLPNSLEEIEELALQLIEKNPPIDAGIRFLVTGGLCGKDYLLPANGSSLIMLFHPFTAYPQRAYTKGMRVITVDLERQNPCVKATNYTPAVMAMKRANMAHVDDAVYLNSSKEMLEATTSNLFFFKEGKWITACDEQVVNGVTRAIFLDLARSRYPIEFRSLHISEMNSCEEAFLCSSVKDAVPLVEIDGKKVGTGLPGRHTAKMRALFHSYIDNYFSKQSEVVLASILK